VVATSIMTNWALAKHRRLKKVTFCNFGWTSSFIYILAFSTQVVKNHYSFPAHRPTLGCCSSKIL
jgi:hypothetical protein